MSLEAVISLLQKMGARHQGEVKKLLENVTTEIQPDCES